MFTNRSMTQRRLLRLAPAVMAGALAATACTDNVSSGQGGPGTTDLRSEEIVLTAGLETVDSCDALLERIKDEAIERVGPYGFDQGGPIGIMEDLAATEAEAGAVDDGASRAATTETEAAADAAAPANGGDGEFSGTNNQEQNVDEADLVKTDGDRLVVVSGNTLRVIDTTAAVPRLTKTIQLPDDTWGGQLFLSGDRALLMTSGWTDRPFVDRSIPTDWYPGSPIGRLVEIDLDEGTVTRALEFEGGYLSAREVGGSIRVVLTASANRFAFVYPSNPDATESATEANKAVIESSTIDHWLPTYRIVEGGETVTEGPIVDCNRVHLPTEFAGFGSMVLLTVDLDDGLRVNDTLSVFTDAQTMYASTERVAVATPRWPTFDERGELVPDDDYSTAVHTFDITDPTSARYVASGSVRGHLLNQYSLSEYQGLLRVATTDGDPWWGGRTESESFVTVLEEDDRSLRTIGQVGGLGRGEQIFAVRFLGDQAYVVTFRQIDPLYTVDLSDPENPRVAGELKIPGFSSYLHPVDDDHLLGVGTDGDEEGFTRGAVVSLFDVSDPADPRRTAKLNLDDFVADGVDGDSYSPVSWDAKAFTWWDGTAIVPVSWWSYDPRSQTQSNGSAAVLIDVDTDGDLREIGRVTHPATSWCDDGVVYEDEPELRPVEVDPADDPDSNGGSTDAEASFVDPPDEDEPVTEETLIEVEIAPERYCESWTPEINRSVIVRDDLYTLSEGGVMVTTFRGLDHVTWIPFESR
jgi:hypothetical protein